MKLDPRAILARQRLPDGRVVVLARGPVGVGAYIIVEPKSELRGEGQPPRTRQEPDDGC